MKKFIYIGLIFFLADCSSNDKYDVARYYDAREQDELLTSIVTFVYTAPAYTSMKDRFLPEHRNYYSFLASKFSIEKYFIADDGTHYFYLIRPGPQNGKRGVGGHFKMGRDFQLTDFQEVFVTPVLPEGEVKGRCAFLFDEMVKGSIDPYLVMESYVQWPNPISYYDTVTYEWKLKPEFDQKR